MTMFEEIDDLKKDLPRINSVTKEVGKYKFNGYQKIAIIMYIIFFITGIILGNLFSTCNLYAGQCVTTEYNFFLMICVWFCGILPCLFIYGMGHIILLLTSINDKIKK